MVSDSSRLLVKNTSLNLIGYMYLLIASFLSVPWLLLGLGTDQFAQYLLLAAIPPILSILDLGMSQAVIRSLAANRQDQTLKVRSTAYAFFLTSSLAVGLITLLILALLPNSPLFLDTGISNETRIFVVGSVMLNHVLAHFSSLAQAAHRFDIYSLKTWVVGTANTLLAGMLAMQGRSLETIFLTLLISYFVTIVVTSYLLDRFSSLLLKPRVYLSTLKELLAYGLRGFMGRAAGQLDLHASKYIMAISLSATSVSAFAIPQTLIYKAVGAISQGTLALFPLASSLVEIENRSKLRKLYYRLQTYLLGLSLLAVLLVSLVGYQFLMWWLGDTAIVNQAYLVLRVLSYFFVALSLTPVASTILDSLGYPEYTSMSAVVTTVINVLLLFVLLPRYGALGAAYAILIATAITTPVFIYMTERVLQSNKIKY